MPCPRIVAATLWMYSAIALTSSSGRPGKGGIGGMPGFCRPLWTTGRIELALLIVEHELRAEQVGAAHVAAPEIRAVADPAVHAKKSLAARDERGIPGGPLLCGEGRRARPRPPCPPGGPWPVSRGLRCALCRRCGCGAPCARSGRPATPASQRKRQPDSFWVPSITSRIVQLLPEEANHMRFPCGFNTTRRPPPLTAPPLHLTGE